MSKARAKKPPTERESDIAATCESDKVTITRLRIDAALKALTIIYPLIILLCQGLIALRQERLSTNAAGRQNEGISIGLKNGEAFKALVNGVAPEVEKAAEPEKPANP